MKDHNNALNTSSGNDKGKFNQRTMVYSSLIKLGAGSCRMIGDDTGITPSSLSACIIQLCEMGTIFRLPNKHQCKIGIKHVYWYTANPEFLPNLDDVGHGQT